MLNKYNSQKKNCEKIGQILISKDNCHINVYRESKLKKSCFLKKKCCILNLEYIKKKEKKNFIKI